MEVTEYWFSNTKSACDIAIGHGHINEKSPIVIRKENLQCYVCLLIGTWRPLVGSN